MVQTSTGNPITNARYLPDFNLSLVRMVLVLILGIVSMYHVDAQSPKLGMAAIAPEWNGKQVCDGYDPTPINSPTFSYSGNGIQEPSYDYSWKQKVDDGAWEDVSAAKKSQFIPSFDPPVLTNTKSGQETHHYSWKLVVTDLGNGAQTVESEAFTLSVTSSISSSYKVVSQKSADGKSSINLTVSGGLPGYTYKWSSLDSKITFPSSQINMKDATGLLPGLYQVLIKDKSCPEVKLVIDTRKPHTK